MGTPAVADITGSGAPLSMGDHVISLYGSQQQQTLVITAGTSIPQMAQRLGEAGIDTEAVLRRQQLVFVGEAELPVPPERFDEKLMMALLWERIEGARQKGWTGLSRTNCMSPPTRRRRALLKGCIGGSGPVGAGLKNGRSDTDSYRSFRTQRNRDEPRWPQARRA